MTDKFQTLIRIMQFGTIKVVPGLINILMIPYLHEMMGGARFGQFSLFLGYALLTITVLGAIVTQPMYRFLSSDQHSLSRFHAVATTAGALGSLGGALSILLIGGTALQALIAAAFVLCAILYAVITVRYQIEAQIRRLVVLEVMRVFVLCMVILGGTLRTGAVSFENALIAFMLSYLVPLIFSAGGARIEWPDRTWLATRIGFGVKSAVWLVLAGLPFTLSKTLLAGQVSDVELGAYSANADMFYRIFGILSVTVVTWGFPVMSAAYDAGKLGEARRVLRFGLAVYICAGLIFLVAVGIGTGIFGQFPGRLNGHVLSFMAVVASCFLWQGMSLAHKPLELTRRTGFMVWLMVLAFALFLSLAWASIHIRGWDPVLGVSIALGVSSIAYSAATMFGFGTRKGAS